MYKYMIIILNIVSALAIVGWFAYMALKSYASAFAVSSGIGYNPPSGTFWIFVAVVVLSIVFSHVDHTNRAILWAIVPIIYLFVVAPFMPVQSYISKHKFDAERQNHQKETQIKVDEKLRSISKEYIKPSDRLNSDELESFITLDKTHNTLVGVTVYPVYNAGNASIQALPVGKINGDTLELYSENMVNPLYFGSHINAQGKTIYDVYKVVYKAGQKYEDYYVDQYELPQNR